MNRWFDGFADASHAPLRADLLRRVLGLFGLLLVLATWRMWTPQTVFPQVPLLGWARDVPAGFHWMGLVGLVAGLLGMLLVPAGRAANAALWLMAGSTLAMAILDQQRMQPWAYQFALLAVVLVASPPRTAILLARLLVTSFYFHSAVTKLDYSFLHTLGQQFLVALFGSAVEGWSDGPGLAAVFPIGELLVAVGLVLPRTRNLALAASIVLHVTLLVILGPWGLDHRPGVLLWNAYFIVQNVVLFWTPRAAVTASNLSPADPTLAERRPAPRAIVVLVLAAAVLPILEPTGWFDIWPSWGLYASSAERVVFQVHRLAEDQLPAGLRPFVEQPSDPDDPWLTVRIDRWALEALSAPIYPQNRVQLGVAQAIADEAQLAERGRAIRLGLADRWSGERSQSIVQGAAQFDAARGEYYLNAAPNHNLRP